MFLIVGLGNPGEKYVYTRHNVGFLTADMFCDLNNFDGYKKAHKAMVAHGRVCDERVAVAKPMTFMNLSGESVVQLLNWYKLEPSDMIVVYDDVNLDVGDIRVRFQGSAGSHNGMKSIIRMLGDDEFPRVRIGVGNKPEGWDLADYVTSNFTDDEKPVMWESMKTACEALKLIMSGEKDEVQQRYNKKIVEKKDEPFF